jgi:hypothetical protein
MRGSYLWTLVALLLVTLLIAVAAQAATVGRFTLVEGQVDVLKRGQVPAAAAKTGDGVEPGDVIRTKSKSKAQVKFVDDSFVTMAPESRIAVADFTYDAASGERRAVLRFFKGVMHTLVTRVQQLQQPDFLMETHTAGLGVRGTENYTVLLPNATGAYLISGLLEVRSNNRQIPETVQLTGMEFTMIPLGQPPRLPKKITPATLETLKALMDTGLKDTTFLGVGGGPSLGSGPQIPEILDFPGSPEYMQPVIPPKLVPPVLTPPVQPQRGPSPSPGPSPGITPGPTVP